ncbi:LysM peptidoglycan-binding domain-containing protein [Amycolatopsis acidicola]|uniref:LysM peptidoglycan-binding domain-containing protein n=1 Tax=Amycolatopsis acidicola TaxID=2596893 RepID=A0A5N0V107_9PSEU|nr:BTAD domain-containing putative transcriptional regulator [Amycolatopsis acidicola]KAA9159436.1 LysM peptidoglycan-binding domain-containing protein [Amycolatopsis acidicola]
MTSQAGQRVRGVLAGLALLVFVAGIPLGLLALGAGPARLMPARWPEPTPIVQWPEHIWNALRWAWLTGDLALWLLIATAWLGWLALTVSVAVEVMRQTGRGVRTAGILVRRVPRRRWIAGLVAAVLVATSAGTATASSRPGTLIAATAPPRPITVSPKPAENLVSCPVVHGDTLWTLAERHLGAGTRYHEIVHLNLALLGENPDELEPGWTLWLPSDAVDLPHPTDTELIGRIVTVNSTDTLSRIAERELGDPDAWRLLFSLNVGRVQPDGRALRDPDLLMPGWRLVLPSQPEPSPRLHATSPPASAPGSPSTPPKPAPAANPSTGISLPTGAFVSLGLAALVTLAMITVRLRRRRWYRPGAPDQADPAELPVVRALRIAFDTATEPVPSERMRPRELETRERAKATVRRSPQDTLLGIRDSQNVALELARAGGLGLVGPGTHAAARALIVAHLAQALRDDVDALVVIPADDAHALFGNEVPEHQLLLADDLPAALDILGTELRRTEGFRHLLLVATPTAETEQRVAALLDEGSRLDLAGVLLGRWQPGVTARVHEDGTVDASDETLTNTRLFTLPAADAHDLLALLKVTGSDRDEPHPPSPGNADYDFVTAEPEAAAKLPPTKPSTTDTTNHGDRCATTSPRPATPLHLQVLGRLHLTLGTSEPTDIIEIFAPRQREILVYLALHREGCRREALTAALWPDAPSDRPYNSFHATLSQLRRSLRQATEKDGAPELVTQQDGHYALDPATVDVDLWQLQDALAAGRRESPPADRLAALRRVPELYRGDLGGGITAEWIESPREALRREALDSLSFLIAEIRNEAPEEALELLENARQLDPYNEAIYRDLMRMQARLGHHASIERTLHLLTTSLSDLDQQPTPDTLRLAEALRQRDDPLENRQAS